ncbi:MAG TPA: agenet domain-containing protein [Hanamia sp.]|jgi:RNA binding activity-knot of a chromodomain.|nr:agenet domain-containing protein [Hanamia sp.]
MKTKLITCLLLIAQCLTYAQKKNSVPNTIVGKWDVWIPGAITYVQKESKVYQVYEPGSALSQLQIFSDGSYQWGNSKSKLSEVRPWYSDENKLYFRLKDLRNNIYDFWYKEATDELIFLFGEVGGHAATGSRIGDRFGGKKLLKDSESGAKDLLSNQSVISKSPGKNVGFKINDKVLVLWSGSWYEAQVLKYKTPKYLVRYKGWGSLYDEWVTVDRIRKEER